MSQSDEFVNRKFSERDPASAKKPRASACSLTLNPQKFDCAQDDRLTVILLKPIDSFFEKNVLLLTIPLKYDIMTLSKTNFMLL